LGAEMEKNCVALTLAWAVRFWISVLALSLALEDGRCYSLRPTETTHCGQGLARDDIGL
jgi:hypothetical protein